MIKKLKKSSKSGSTIIEFALIFPIFLFLVLAVIEYSFIFMVRSWMEFSVADLSRYAKVYARAAEGGGDFNTDFRNRVADRSVLIARDRLVLTDELDGSAADKYDQKVEFCQELDTGKRVSACNPAGGCTGGANIGYIDGNGNGRCDADGARDFLPGVPGQLVTYRLIYKWDLMTPFIGGILGDENGQHVIQAVGVVRNES